MAWIWIIVAIVVVLAIIWLLLMRRDHVPGDESRGPSADPRVEPGGPHTLGTGAGSASTDAGGPGFSGAFASTDSTISPHGQPGDVDRADGDTDSSPEPTADSWADPTAPHPEERGEPRDIEAEQADIEETRRGTTG